MPGLTDTGEAAVMDEIWNAGVGTFPSADLFIALHTGDPGENGASNEVAGGSYARQQAPFTRTTNTVTNDANIDFAGMPAVGTPGVVAWSAWDAVSAGNCWWTGWFSTVSQLFVVEAADLATNDVTSPSHGLIADDRVMFEAIGGEGSLPTGITEGTLYFVIATGLATDTFRIATTSGGAAVDITAVGVGVWRKVAGQTVSAGNIFRIATGDLDVAIF